MAGKVKTWVWVVMAIVVAGSRIHVVFRSRFQPEDQVTSTR